MDNEFTRRFSSSSYETSTSRNRPKEKSFYGRFSTLDSDTKPPTAEHCHNNPHTSPQHESLNKAPVSKHKAREILRHFGKRLFSNKQKNNLHPKYEDKNHSLHSYTPTTRPSAEPEIRPKHNSIAAPLRPVVTMASAEVSQNAEVNIATSSGFESHHEMKQDLSNEDLNNNPREMGEVSVAELEDMLEQYPEYDKRVKIRNTLIQLKRELENNQSKGQDSRTETNERSSPTEKSSPTESEKSPKEIKTSEFSITFKVSNPVTRAESAKTARPTYSPIPNVGRAGSFNLSRPKDFIVTPKQPIHPRVDVSPPTNTTPLSIQRPSSPQNSYNRVTAPFGKSLIRRASSPVITSTPLHTKAHHSASPLAQPVVTIKRSDSTKENHTVSPIPVGQGNIRRSRSILGRVLGLKIVSENSPAAKSFPQVVNDVIKEQLAEKSVPDLRKSPPSSLDSSGEKSPHSSTSSEESDSEVKSEPSSASSSDVEYNSYSVQTAERRIEFETSETKSSKSPSISSQDSESSTPDEQDNRISIKSNIVSTACENNETSDDMDRYTRRALQNRVSVKAQILAAEDGKLNDEKTKNIKSPQRIKPIFGGDNLASRLNKYSSTTENTKPSEHTKTRNTRSTKSPSVENHSSKFEKNNNIIDSKTTNIDRKIENGTTPTTRRSRREISSNATTKVNGAKMLEEVAKITTEELKTSSRKHSSSKNKNVTTPTEDLKSSSRKHSSSKKKDITTPTEEVTVFTPLDDVENSLSSWSERRRKKRGQKDINDNITSTPPPTPVEESNPIEISVSINTDEPATTDIKSQKKNYKLDLHEEKVISNGISPVSPMSAASSTESTGSGRSRRRRGRITSQGGSSVTSEPTSSVPGTPVVEEQNLKDKTSTPVENVSVEVKICQKTDEEIDISEKKIVEEEEAVQISVEFQEAKNDVEISKDEVDVSPVPAQKEIDVDIKTDEICDQEFAQTQNEDEKSITSVDDTNEVTLSEPTKESSHDIDTDQVIENSDVSDVIENKPNHEEGKTEVINESDKSAEKKSEDVPTAKPRRRRIRSNVEDKSYDKRSPELKKKIKEEINGEENKPKKTEEETKEKRSVTDESATPNIVITAEPEIKEKEEEAGVKEENITETQENNMQITLDNLDQCKDENVLEKMLDNCDEYEDRRKIRKALRTLRKSNNDKAINNKLSMLKSSQHISTNIESKSKDDIAISTSKYSRSISSQDGNRVLKQETKYLKTTEISGSGTKVTAKLRTTMSTREPKKIGSIFDREDDEDTKPKGGSKFELERRKNERRHDIQRIRSLPAASSKDARKAFVAKLEAQSPKPTGNKKIGRSPTFVVPNAQNVKQMLLKWLQAKTRGYNHVDVRNFSSSWANGMAFCALVHHFFPDAFDYDSLDPKNRAENFTLAFDTAEKFANADPLLDVEDMMIMGNRPDSKCVFTYCQSLYNKLRKFDAPLAPLKLHPPVKEVEDNSFSAVPESEDL